MINLKLFQNPTMNPTVNSIDLMFLVEQVMTLLLNYIADAERVPPNHLTELYFLPNPEYDHYSLQENAPANNQVEAKPESYGFVMTPLSQSLLCGKLNSDVRIFIKSDGETIFLRNPLCTVYVNSNEEVQAIFNPNSKNKSIR
jgi:hypothetical protein